MAWQVYDLLDAAGCRVLTCLEAVTCSDEGDVIKLFSRLHDPEPSADWLCKLLSS